MICQRLHELVQRSVNGKRMVAGCTGKIGVIGERIGVEREDSLRKDRKKCIIPSHLCHETTHWLAEAPGQQFTKDIHGISLPHFDYCGYPEATHCNHKANQRTRISRPGHSERGDREVISREIGFEAKYIPVP